MGFGKWIGGIVGFMAMGPLGALAGYAIGSLLEKASDAGGTAGGGSYGDAYDPYAGQRNSFLFSMLVMASYIIRADGRIMHSEMEFVRRFLRANFGEAAVSEGEQILLNLFEQRKQMERANPAAFRNTIHECGAQIAANLTYEQRLQMLDFLAKIAQSDGNVCKAEIDALKEVARSMGLSDKEVESMLNLRGNSLEDAYKVLEVSPEATDAEVRAAYRRLALKHHPDKVATLGEDIRRAAEEKLQEIYEEIRLPKRATAGSAGYDFYTPVPLTVRPGETVKIPTGIRVKMDPDWVLKCYPRSGLGFKYRLQLNNTVGIIDSDYYGSDNEGHIFAKLTNDSKEGKVVELKAGAGFMQGIFVEYGITVDDDATEIRNGGFGSTTNK